MKTKLIFGAVLFIKAIAFTCNAQQISLDWIKEKCGDKNIYEFKLFNNTNSPIGIKCSMFFNKFSEIDTLNLAVGDLNFSRDSTYYYGIHRSISDVKYSVEIENYQLLLVNPQTYLIFKIKLEDYEKYKAKTKFLFFYTNELSAEDVKRFIRKDKELVQITNQQRDFLYKEITFSDSP